jgi:hypothetical protein
VSVARTALVVTSIAAPNDVMRALAKGCAAEAWDFIVIGDVPSPPDFSLPGCRFFGVTDQQRLDFEYAHLAPLRHYARKNIGYLLAMADGADCIVETDDDNLPTPAFFQPQPESVAAAVFEQSEWTNAYAWFGGDDLWPRGLPLDRIRDALPAPADTRLVRAPIQQGLADDNPDVDAVYRLVMPLPRTFTANDPIALGTGSWCPFNSQNTRWFPAAYPLLYLPATCSFRMTDIWRSFVAQRIAQENGWHVLFHRATVRQERNEHDLMRDFADEIPGYLHNDAIMRALANLPLRRGQQNIAGNLRACYELLVERGWLDAGELTLLSAWLADLAPIFGAVRDRPAATGSR